MSRDNAASVAVCKNPVWNFVPQFVLAVNSDNAYQMFNAFKWWGLGGERERERVVIIQLIPLNKAYKMFDAFKWEAIVTYNSPELCIYDIWCF